IIRISSRLCRPALPVRGSSRPSKHAANASIPSPTREPQHHAGRIDSLSRRNTQPKCQEHSKCDSPALLEDSSCRIDIKIALVESTLTRQKLLSGVTYEPG